MSSHHESDGDPRAATQAHRKEDHMKHTTRAAMAAPVLGLAALLAAAGPATAATGSLQADLTPLNEVDGSGKAMAQVDGTSLSFTLASQGLLADAPHAAHIHFGADARQECPTAADNANGDEFLTTAEGQPAYGPIVVSLTKSGDTSPDSALAVDRFAVGPDFEYSRGDVQVSEDVAQAITSGKGVVVVHGVDHDGNGEYSVGPRGASELDASLPGEATDPALCGVLNASQMSGMPSGGVDAGAGSTAGVENAGLIGAGALAAAGGVVLLARRRTSTER
jgi:hypothetical protein